MSRKTSHCFSDFYAKQKEFRKARKQSFLVALTVAEEFKMVISQAQDELAWFGGDLYENHFWGEDQSSTEEAYNKYASDLKQAHIELSAFLARV